MATPWPPADKPSPDSADLRYGVLAAARTGDLDPARDALHHPDDRVRATAVRALFDNEALDASATATAQADASPRVRRALAELHASGDLEVVESLLTDADPTVVEMACWAAGEHGADADRLVPQLVTLTIGHDDALCREAAVAALGAIGSADGLDAILGATRDKATVRRRAVLALAPFDGPAVDEALERALTDRDWQVRQAAEDVLPPDSSPSATSEHP